MTESGLAHSKPVGGWAARVAAARNAHEQPGRDQSHQKAHQPHRRPPCGLISLVVSVHRLSGLDKVEAKALLGAGTQDVKPPTAWVAGRLVVIKILEPERWHLWYHSRSERGHSLPGLELMRRHVTLVRDRISARRAQEPQTATPGEPSPARGCCAPGAAREVSEKQNSSLADNR